ncbi:MAG: M28 family peptidase [Anaerolineales bacterium]|nr:M28 family peptidase [Anaerolineales bacterium]
MEFHPNDALKHARSLSRPRLTGSGEDAVVAAEITTRLASLGYLVNEQKFQFYASLNNAIILELAIGYLLILGTIGLRSISPWASVLPVILLALLLLLSTRIHRAVLENSFSYIEGCGEIRPSSICARLGPEVASGNVIARYPSQRTSGPHLILVAHYDSKSQRIPLPLRMISFALIIIGSVIFIVLNLLALAIPAVSPIATYTAVSIMILGLPLFFQTTENHSPGAIDNASGTGLLIHIAEVLAGRPDITDNLRVTLLFSGAEEQGLMGAYAYVLGHETDLQPSAEANELYVLNFDGIGMEGNLRTVHGSGSRKHHSTHLHNLLNAASQDLKIPLSPLRLIGAMMDHIPFAQRGWAALSLAISGRDSRRIHTPHDTPDKLHHSGFEFSGLMTLHVMETLVAAGKPFEKKEKNNA